MCCKICPNLVAPVLVLAGSMLDLPPSESFEELVAPLLLVRPMELQEESTMAPNEFCSSTMNKTTACPVLARP